MKHLLRRAAWPLLLACWTVAASAYENLQVAVYARAQEVARMSDPAWLAREWQRIADSVHVDKVYLEVHRDGTMPDDSTLEAAKAFFAARGVKTAAGITYTIDEGNRFQTFSYDTPADRKRAQMIAETAARHFDEVILDDFFFTSAKTEQDIRARGNRGWTEHRLARMTEAGRNLVVAPAKRVNPKVKVIIKYPNWYEHFQALGFNLETGPAGVRWHLHGHRDARCGARRAAPAAVPRLLHHALLREPRTGTQWRWLGRSLRLHGL